MEVVFTEQFLDRLEEYADYIALDNIPAAVEWAQKTLHQCRILSEYPGSGRIVPELGLTQIREILHGNYRLIYEIKPGQIQLLTIWHNRQMLPGNFRKDS
jgi:plasmid stabilization system protein ParE